jgi:phosphotransacetylase
LDPEQEEPLSGYVQRFQDLRGGKAGQLRGAGERMKVLLFFRAMMLRLGEVDGCAAGVAHFTSDGLRAGLQIVGLTPEVEANSGHFL